MSLRDYFAAAALTGLLANPEREGGTDNEWAQFTYELADAMLLARARKEDEGRALTWCEPCAEVTEHRRGACQACLVAMDAAARAGAA